MGISLAWVAVKGLEPAAVLSRLGLAATGRDCDDHFDDIAAHPLPDDALLVAARGCDHRVLRSHHVARLSIGCRVLSCAVEEHAGFASCALWEDGRRVWQVEYVGCEDPEEFYFEGELPQRFHVLHANAAPTDSDDLDGYFLMDIPLMLAREWSGYRHDDADPAFDAIPFQELQALSAGTGTDGGWWKRLWA